MELRLLSFSSLRIHTGRGYVDTKKKRTADAIRARFRLHERLWRFRDVRTKPKIPLPTILLSVLLMPLWSAGSLLALDRLARTASARAMQPPTTASAELAVSSDFTRSQFEECLQCAFRP